MKKINLRTSYRQTSDNLWLDKNDLMQMLSDFVRFALPTFLFMYFMNVDTTADSICYITPLRTAWKGMFPVFASFIQRFCADSNPFVS